MNILSPLVAAYLCGSIPTAVWTGRLLRNIDIRQHGSKNAGATNVYRVLGWRPALFVVAIDVGKGVLPALFFPLWFMSEQAAWAGLACGLAAVLGHVYTIFAGFRGGKGVGTAAGMLLALFPLAFPLCLLVFAGVLALGRIVSLASILATFALPLAVYLQEVVSGKPTPAYLWWTASALPLFILFTHRSNVVRLLQGRENRLGSPGNQKPPV